MQGADLCFEAIFDRLRFSFIGNDAQDVARLENLSDGHRDRSSRNFFKAAEPPFADLLTPASLVEFDNQIRLCRFKVGGRIVESQMTVFADADERRINRVSRDNLSQSAALVLRVWPLTFDVIKIGRMNALSDALPEILSETRRVRAAQ